MFDELKMFDGLDIEADCFLTQFIFQKVGHMKSHANIGYIMHGKENMKIVQLNFGPIDEKHITN